MISGFIYELQKLTLLKNSKSIFIHCFRCRSISLDHRILRQHQKHIILKNRSCFFNFLPPCEHLVNLISLINPLTSCDSDLLSVHFLTVLLVHPSRGVKTPALQYKQRKVSGNKLINHLVTMVR